MEISGGRRWAHKQQREEKRETTIIMSLAILGESLERSMRRTLRPLIITASPSRPHPPLSLSLLTREPTDLPRSLAHSPSLLPVLLLSRAPERTPEGVAVHHGVGEGFQYGSDAERTKAGIVQVSHETGLVMISNQEGALLKNARDSYKTVFSAKMKHVVGLDVSPLGNFFVTYQRPTGESGEKNLKVWRVSDASAPVFAQPQKQASQDMWPLYQFDENEEHMYRSVANEVHAIKCADFAGGISKKLRVKGLASFGISRGKEPKIAVYVPEVKGAPGSVQVYDISTDFSSAKADAPPTPCARRSFYRSSEAKLMWNATGNALLAWAFSDVDKTNQNYFGEQSLHYLSGTYA